MGREYSLLGNYDTAMVYYEGVCQAIKQQINRRDLSSMHKENWVQAQDQVTLEYRAIKDISNELKAFLVDPSKKKGTLMHIL